MNLWKNLNVEKCPPSHMVGPAGMPFVLGKLLSSHFGAGTYTPFSALG
ncbi:predicted protein [Botrytis cinerea T4]|uniref:Uncharacterized protein n=1 Tax=Botryotinia fuckeliana (strain T4) TaxID=999810 RepID=G2XXU4_BOTF4|nr:predicted protein [Botrytis cinerea T4]